MNEHLSVGAWPANAVADINTVRTCLQDGGYSDADFTLIAHYRVLNILKHQVSNTAFTYEDWLREKDILYDIIMDSTLPEDVAIIYATKKNFPITHEIDGGTQLIKYDSAMKITGI